MLPAVFLPHIHPVGDLGRQAAGMNNSNDHGQNPVLDQFFCNRSGIKKSYYLCAFFQDIRGHGFIALGL